MKSILLILLLLSVSYPSTFQDGLKAFDDKNYKEALIIFKKYAKLDNIYAQYNLGLMYKKGLGVKQDYKEAFKWYEKAALLNNTNAQNNLGLMYKNAEGVEQNYKESVKWFEKSASSNNKVAQYNLGRMYFEGKGVKKDHKKAIMWYEKSANQDYHISQNNLGIIYAEKDLEKAVFWYKKAIKNGNAKAKCNIADSYIKLNNNAISSLRQLKQWVKEGYAQTKSKYCEIVWNKYKLYNY